MAMATPVVATRPAFEGVEATEGDGVLVGDAPGAFADHVVKLLEDTGFADDLGRRGRQLVEERYRWDRQLGKLDDLIDTVLGEHSSVPPGTGSKTSTIESLEESTTSPQ
jgi:glycosyltransferase involved in cell wall biosynthesis